MPLFLRRLIFALRERGRPPPRRRPPASPRRPAPDSTSATEKPRKKRRKIDPLAHQGLVGVIAKSFLGRGLEFEDLMGYGQVGLLIACDRFDPSREIRFSTYASHWIKCKIRDAIRDTAPLVRVPARLLDARRRDASPACLDAADAARVARVLRDHDGDGDSSPLAELVLDDADPARDVDAREDVAHLLGRLGPREAEVLSRRFGLGGREPETLAEIGLDLGMVKERVRQVEAEALERLRRSDDASGLVVDWTRFLEEHHMKRAASIERDDNGPAEAPANGVHPKPAPEASGNGSCPDYGHPYGRRRRCYHCKPAIPKGTTLGPRASAAPARNGHAAPSRLPSVERLDFTRAAVPGPAIDPERSRNSAARELHAMAEILAIAEALTPDEARRALGWVLERVGAAGGAA